MPKKQVRKPAPRRSGRASPGRTKTPRPRGGSPSSRPRRAASPRRTREVIEDQSVLQRISIRTPQGVIRFPARPTGPGRNPPSLKRAAMQWSYVVRNRQRWAERSASIADQAERCRSLMTDYGLTETDLRRLAESGQAEVAIPFESEEIGWEARIFPWEYMLTAATRDIRRGSPLTVMRQLERGGTGRRPQRADRIRVLFVESAPSALREAYSFESERELVRSNLSSAECEALAGPTREGLTEKIRSYQPEVIHLTGFDTHQGLALLGLREGDEGHDGYLLRRDSGRPDPVGADDLAEIVTAGSEKPALVSCSMWNSAARVAPLIVARGAGAAIGFQDEFDDAQIELFFANFYHAWRLARWDLARAFPTAWNSLRQQPGGLRGTGLVLWSAEPLLAPAAAAARRAARPPADLERQLSDQRSKDLTPADAPEGDIHALVRIDPKPRGEINYSLLHNNRGLFESFPVLKFKPGRVRGVSVSVELHVGTDSYPYRTTVELTEPVTELKDRIRIPLTSSLARSIQESIHTSLYIEVRWRDHELYRDTRRVTLLPIDQWRDDDTDRVWLPSFVLPRDPAVVRIVDAAQRYLMALQDDPAAGFDGYQSLDPDADDPSETIDRQVQAIWSALLYDQRLSYVNPPPSYSLSSQRIRTPSEVLSGGRGTCIDLAIMLAACLELVDIYPVIFLLEGHAFPGYWRSETAYEAFQEVASANVEDLGPSDARRSAASGAPREPWYMPKSAYREIVQQVRKGDLVPLETVWLTSHKGFEEAYEAGLNNLRSREEFHSMIDVIQARRHGVTPLPIGNGAV